MKKSLLLLIPLIAFGDSTSYNPKDYTYRERIQIDKLSSQTRLYDRVVRMSKVCTPSRARALYRRNVSYLKLKQLEPYTSKYYSKITDTEERNRLREYNDEHIKMWRTLQRDHGYPMGPIPNEEDLRK